MKIFMVLFVSLFATAAMSCPPINSKFQCEKNTDDPSDTGVISVESVQSGVNIFYKWTDMDSGESSMYPTDGQIYSMENGGTYVGTCAGDNLQMILTGTDATVGPYTVDMYYTLDSAQNLFNKGTIQFTYQGQNHTEEFENTCTKL